MIHMKIGQIWLQAKYENGFFKHPTILLATYLNNV